MGRVIDCKKYDIYKRIGIIYAFGLLCVAITEIEASSYSFSRYGFMNVERAHEANM